MVDNRSDVLKKADSIDSIVIPKWEAKLSSDRILYNLLALLFDEEENDYWTSDDDWIRPVSPTSMNNNVDELGYTDSDRDIDDDRREQYINH